MLDKAALVLSALEAGPATLAGLVAGTGLARPTRGAGGTGGRIGSSASAGLRGSKVGSRRIPPAVSLSLAFDGRSLVKDMVRQTPARR